MDLTALRIFLAVAEERSFSRAAAKVHRTQPAVSQAVKRLEHDLGEQLFDREADDFARDIVYTWVFRPDGSVDTAAFEGNLELYAQHDLAGALVLGSNGEAGSLDEGEKLALVGIARAHLDERLLLVGVGLESTRATIALAQKVADLGADAALVLTPHYYKARMTAEALTVHFEAVADASPIPILLYSVPAFTGITWPAGLAETLAAHPNIAGIKESSGDLALMGRLCASTPESFAVASGSAPTFYAALCVGASAGRRVAPCRGAWTR